MQRLEAGGGSGRLSGGGSLTPGQAARAIAGALTPSLWSEKADDEEDETPKSVTGVTKSDVARREREKFPVQRVSRAEFPDTAANIAAAIAEGYPTVLTRVDRDTKKANRKRAVRQYDSRASEGLYRDEYPFASARPRGADARVAYAPRDESGRQGTEIDRFYREENVLVGNRFTVEIVP